MHLLFNVAGPCLPSEHYMIDPLRNIGKEVLGLIDSKHYFVIHAARQSGKTTLLLELTDKIEAEGKYYALYCSLEKIQGIADSKEAMPEIIDALKMAFYGSNIPQAELFAKEPSSIGFASLLQFELSKISKTLDKPLIIFFDEADCLSESTLISFLRQLRNGYISRSKIPFIHSLALVGMRNIRDYKAHIRDDSATLGSASPFNIVTESLSIRTFTKDEVSELYSQHTAETSQIFEPQTIDCIFEQTQGQPWLVNAIARECVEKICKKDYSTAITQEMAKDAINNIILARGTHFDSLMERLKEPRIRRVIEPLIIGEDVINRSSDDFLYARDLGLIKEAEDKVISPANQIYAEVIARALSWNIQANLMSKKEYEIPKYIKDGKIDVSYLLKEFQDFWCKNSEIFKEHSNARIYDYVEATPHLVLQAFLQRVINGGGKIHREFAAGSGRADLCIEYGGYEYPIELKLFRGPSSVSKGLEQLSDYVERCRCEEGWLVMFDRSTKKSWEEKLYMRLEEYNGKRITVVGA